MTIKQQSKMDSKETAAAQIQAFIKDYSIDTYVWARLCISVVAAVAAVAAVMAVVMAVPLRFRHYLRTNLLFNAHADVCTFR